MHSANASVEAFPAPGALPHPLLMVLHRQISHDQGISGFPGLVSVGVKPAQGETAWWAFTAGDRPAGGFVEAPPPRSDAVLLLNAAAADKILAGEKPALDAGAFTISGKIAVLDQFINRYLRKRTGLSLRLHQGKGNK